MQFGGARWSLGGPWVLPGGCLVVIGHKLKVLESLVNGVFCPLAPRGGFGGDPPPHSRAYRTRGLSSVPKRSCKTKFASSKIKNYKEGNSINIDLWENGFLKSLLDS